jgi:hypothetical protein
VRFSVDPWDPSYGASVDRELTESSAEVDAGVEVPVERWAPIDPDRSLLPPEAVLFVDGVRRIDAQVWVDESDGLASPALCATYAAGVVCSCPDGGAHVVETEIGRGLFATAAAGSDIVTAAGRYGFVHATGKKGTDPTQLLSQAVQVEMGRNEMVVAAKVREGHGIGRNDLLVMDGPLRGRDHPSRAVGLVKTHSKTYLPAELGGIVAALAPLQRTPVFRMGDPAQDQLLDRYTWYFRLPCAGRSPWAGVARLECGGQLSPAEAVMLASLSQATLPRFASTEYKDARAPQNLYPIAGLERRLRRRLGDPKLMYRALRRAATA